MADTPILRDEDINSITIQVARNKAQVRNDTSIPSDFKVVGYDISELAGVAHCKATDLKRSAIEATSNIIHKVSNAIGDESQQPTSGLPNGFMKQCTDAVHKTR